MYGKDYNYARSRLVGSIVRIKGSGEPIRIDEMEGSDINCHKLINGEGVRVKLADVNCEPVTLGYCNFGEDAHYLYRMAIRQDWRQGLRDQTLGSTRGRVRVPPSHLALTIKNEYPNLQECIRNIRDGYQRSAFCRRWALVAGQQLEYMGSIVGKFTNGGQLTLDAKHQYLQEVLDAENN